jgi:hypothetical protein
VLVLLASRGMGQELIPRPDPIGGMNAAPHTTATDVFANVPPAERWRYRWVDSRWWYWTPAGRWMWYSDGRGWIEFNATASGPSPYDGYYRADPPYTLGYAPGVVTYARPYGDVNVGVGRRIGVDVYGPHGAVRVGRIFVGW